MFLSITIENTLLCVATKTVFLDLVDSDDPERRRVYHLSSKPRSASLWETTYIVFLWCLHHLENEMIVQMKSFVPGKEGMNAS